MKTFLRILYLITLLFQLISCVPTMNKKFNEKDFNEVIQLINKSDTLTGQKKLYIIDNLRNFRDKVSIDLDKKINESKKFSDLVLQYSTDYDNELIYYTQLSETNDKLKKILTLISAEPRLWSEYLSYIDLKIKCQNPFEKEILYVELYFKYVDAYDTEHFSERVKLTEESAGNFNKEILLTTKEAMNDASTFMDKQYMAGKLDNKLMMAGLKLEPIKVVFKDKSSVEFIRINWKYFK